MILIWSYRQTEKVAIYENIPCIDLFASLNSVLGIIIFSENVMPWPAGCNTVVQNGVLKLSYYTSRSLLWN